MSIKGTQTEKNLLAAFQGESMARNKYTFFAQRAKQENHPEIAALFDSLATNETMHGKLLYQKLTGIGNTTENLQTAASGEYGEWSSMYPEFAAQARQDGFEDIAVLFENIAKIEKDHEMRFMQALLQLQSAGAPAEAPSAAAPKTVTVQGYRCQFCGATFDHRPDVCEVCGAIGSFEETSFKKTV